MIMIHAAPGLSPTLIERIHATRCPYWRRKTLGVAHARGHATLLGEGDGYVVACSNYCCEAVGPKRSRPAAAFEAWLNPSRRRK